jgi:hypothetical protein
VYAEDLHHLPLPADDGDGLSPLPLRILAWLKLYGKKQRGRMLRLAPR